MEPQELNVIGVAVAAEKLAGWRDVHLIEPKDDKDLPWQPDAIYSVGAGYISGMTWDGVQAELWVPAGFTLSSVQFARIHDTGTTARGLVALRK